MIRKIGAWLGGVVLLVTMTACSVNTEYDEAAIVYYGGRGGATKFVKCVGPSQHQSVNGTDNTWSYHAGQRTFSFTGMAGAESQPISVVSKDNVEMTVPGIATFALNTWCPALQQFHERIGRKYAAFFESTDSTPGDVGWNNMLNTYLRVPLDQALDSASQEFEWRDLYNDPKAKLAWQTRVGELATAALTETARGQFFCNPSFNGSGGPAGCGHIVLTIQKPQPPQALIDAMAAEQVAKAENAAQAQRNAKIRTELESIKDLVGVLGKAGAIFWAAVQKGEVSVLPVPQGSGLTIPK